MMQALIVEVLESLSVCMDLCWSADGTFTISQPQVDRLIITLV